MKLFWVLIFVVLVLATALAVGLWWLLPVPHNSARYTAQDWVVFAEVYGGIIGTLVAALAFAGLIYTVLMQREELSLQRKELKETREELTRTANAQEASEKALQKQVRAAQIAAQLTASTALLGFYKDEEARGMARGAGREKVAEAREWQELYSRQILALLDEAGEHFITRVSKRPWPPSDSRNQ